MNLYFRYFKFSSLFTLVFALMAIKYGLFEPFGIATALDNFRYGLLILAATSIACAGIVMHHIIDRDALVISDHSNDGDTPMLFTEKQEYSLFMLLNFIGVAIGFYLSHYIDRSAFSSFFILTSGLVYLHATYLKQLLVIGNIVIPLFAVLLILLPGIFDLLPAITAQNVNVQATIFSILVDYAALIFVVLFLQELVKDCAALDADYHRRKRTIPMLLGRERTMKMASILTLLPIAMVFWYSYTYLFSSTMAVSYGLLVLIGPLLYVMIKCWNAQHKSDFSLLLTVLKIVSFFAIGSFTLYHLVVAKA